jgi:hypothetical protein
MKQNHYMQRVWVRGTRPEEEETFQFSMVQVVYCSPFNDQLHHAFKKCLNKTIFVVEADAVIIDKNLQ